MNWKLFWNGFLQKLITQLISIKVWVMAALFLFVGFQLITPAIFATVMGTVLGIKGAYAVAGILKNKNEDVIRRV